MNNEKREQEMMAAADRYADEVCDESCTGAQVVETINDFCAGWRAADFHPAWVSVEDRLPKRMSEKSRFSETVLVYNKEGFNDTAYYDYEEKIWRWLPGVTHWMPLPAPPVKKGGEQ